MDISPVLLDIISNKVTSVAEEAGFTIKRIGHSLYVKETSDFGTALVNLAGKAFAYPSATGVSGFVDVDCGPTIRAVEDLQPGDVIITNHPYLSEGLATHTPDIHLVVPYAYQGKIVCYGWSFLHCSDISGKVPGSISPSNTELFQEGLLIPPIKLMTGGKFNQDTVRLLRANSRTPDANIGDIKAMISAHKIAERRVAETIEQYGLDVFMQSQHDLIEYAALKAREVLRTIPDGEYEFWDWMDDDLVTRIPLRIRVKMTARDGKVHLDFSGTDPQTLASYNVPTMGRRHVWLTLRLMAFICTYDKTIPLNSGIFEHITVTVPEGSLLNPVFPASVGVRHASALRVNDVIGGVVHLAAPERMLACVGGVVIPVVLAEPSLGGKRNVLVIQSMIGGMGGRYGIDGVDGRGSGLSNMSNNPLESVEANAAVVMSHYMLRPDSGGPGKWRGGCGIQLTFEVLRDGCSVLGRGMERFRFQPWGVEGGLPGAGSETILNMGRPGERALGKIDIVHLKKGDTFTVLTPGGGGYGDAFERDPEAVLLDVRRGLVSLASAERDYGVVIRDGAVSPAATDKARAARARTAPQKGFVFDRNRQLWDQVCDDETMNALTQALSRFPAEDRSEARRRLFVRVFPELEGPQPDFATLFKDPSAQRRRLCDAICELASA